MAETHVLHPAGTNMMGFDLPFLEHYLFAEDQWGRFHRMLSYRSLDMTAIRLTQTALGADPYEHYTEPKTHRVKDCLDTDIHEYVEWLELVK